MSRLRLIGRVSRDKQRLQGAQRLNRLSKTKAHKALLDCCGSPIWATQMVNRMPFADVSNILETADKLWTALSEAEWHQAFRHHPAIGAKRAEKAQSATAKRWSKGEQAVANTADSQILAALARANQEYQSKFGYVFLIFATGKTSEDILASLRQRLLNDPAEEFRIAAEELRKITRIRLEKLLAS